MCIRDSRFIVRTAVYDVILAGLCIAAFRFLDTVQRQQFVIYASADHVTTCLLYTSSFIDKIVEELHFFRCIFHDIADHIFPHGLCKDHVIFQISECDLRLDHPEFCCMTCCVGVLCTESRSAVSYTHLDVYKRQHAFYLWETAIHRELICQIFFGNCARILGRT